MFKLPKYIPFRKSTKAKLLIVGGLLFALGVGTSAVATSAWYSIVESGAIGDLNLKIRKGEDAWFELGLLPVGETDKEKDENGFIWNSEGYDKQELGIEGKYLGEVSGMYQSDWYDQSKLNELVPKFHSRYRLGSPKTNPGYAYRDDEDSFYVQNEFQLVAGESMEIYLDSSTSIEPNTEMNRETAEKKGFSNDIDRVKALDDVVHAVRISILTEDGYWIFNRGETGETYYGGILDLDKDGYYDYDYTTNKEFLYGEYLGDPTHSLRDDNVEDSPDVKKGNRNVFVAAHKQGVEQVDEQSVTIQKEKAYKLSQGTFDINDPIRDAVCLCKLNKGESKRMIVSVYVEGWDKKMTDDIASASFDINIAFTGLIKN